MKDLNQLNLGTLTALSRTVDAKSSWTAGHSERVTQYALAVGKAMELNASDLETLQRAALLHDIGKIGVSADILDKTGKLDDVEFREIQTHSRMGARILEPIGSYSDAIPIILQHHERHDGTGYPYGLIGGSILIGARIIAVCDVFDALTNDRPYRKAWSREKVIDLIKEESGKKFAPKVVDLFLSAVVFAEETQQ
ncbi:MAG: HD-GYP domain-containing protein [Desulfobacterales bacterium]